MELVYLSCERNIMRRSESVSTHDYILKKSNPLHHFCESSITQGVLL